MVDKRFHIECQYERATNPMCLVVPELGQFYNGRILAGIVAVPCSFLLGLDFRPARRAFDS